MRLAPTPRPPRLSPAGMILALYSALALVAVGWGALRGNPNVFVLASVPRHTLAGIGAGCLFAVVVVFFSRFTVHRFEWARTIDREFREILGPMGGGERFLLAAASSVGEEFFFRGALLPYLGLWASSAVFALPHIGPSWKFLPWTVTSFFVGVVFGKLFLLGGDLAGPICAHFLINLINLRYITARRG